MTSAHLSYGHGYVVLISTFLGTVWGKHCQVRRGEISDKVAHVGRNVCSTIRKVSRFRREMVNGSLHVNKTCRTSLKQRQQAKTSYVVLEPFLEL